MMMETQSFEIVDYADRYKPLFESLNREWIEEYFRVEDVDLRYFADPRREILAKGGEIFFARSEDQILGTCSLIRGKGPTELARMAVTRRARGLGLGEFLAREAIRRAKAHGDPKLILVTNTRLAAAIALYKKLGFTAFALPGDMPYERADLAMELPL